MKHFTLTIAAAAALLSTAADAAPSMHEGHAQHMGTHAAGKMQKSPAVKAYNRAFMTMHKAMDIAYSGDADSDFATGMIPHHQGAVDMAKVELAYGKDEELKALAQRIIAAQRIEIGVMGRWLESHASKAKNGNNDATQAYKAAMEKMHKAMNIKYTGNADVDFARGMIPHHQGAIDMAWVLIEHGRDPMLREMARGVVRSQSQEIELMNAWLKAHTK